MSTTRTARGAIWRITGFLVSMAITYPSVSRLYAQDQQQRKIAGAPERASSSKLDKRPLTQTVDPVIDFESLTTGGPGGAGSLTAVFRQFANQGILFNGPKSVDYSVGPFAIAGFAHSGTKALEACVAQEFCTVPIEMDFTTPQKHIKVIVGYSARLNQPTAVVLQAFDRSGNVVGSATASFSASTNPQPIQTPLEVSVPSANIVRATVSLSAGTLTFNNNLAIDDVEFDTAGAPPQCTATQPPTVVLTQPTGETVYSNEFLFQGLVTTGDQLNQATLTATSAGGATRASDILSSGLVQPTGGTFGPTRFDGLLFPGLNTITVTARDCGGTGQSSSTVNFVLPTSPRIFGAELNQGLPTYPLVADKTTLVRVYVGANDPNGATRIDRALLDVTRLSTGAVFTVSATIPDPIFTNTAQQFTENDNINFYLPGGMLPEGSYALTARLYNGLELLNIVPLPNNPYTFTKTQDVRLLVVLPDVFAYERPLSDLALLSDYLNDIARVFPVRDGWGLIGDNAGLQVSLRLFEPVCDGTFPSPFPNCGPTQQEMASDPAASFKWRLVQPRSSGQLRTAMSAFTTTSVPCPGRNALSFLNDGNGGLRSQFVPGAFVYFPGFLPNTADAAFDINYDGRIDASELRPYTSEYFNGRTNAWSTDLTQLQPGDIVHSFIDSNRDCAFTPGESQSPFTQGKLVTWMLQKARALADASNLNYAAYVIWPGMDQSGTGGGTNYGNTLWAVLKPWPAFHQELGHGFGMVSSSSPNFDGCCHSVNLRINDPRAFDILRRKALVNPISVMARGLGSPYANSLLEQFEYNFLFQQLRQAALTNLAVGGSGARSGAQFALRAYVDKADHFQILDSSATSELESTPISEKSAYSIVFLATGKKMLARDQIPVTFESPTEKDHVAGGVYASDAFLRIVRPLPNGTTAVEVRRNERVLARIDKPTMAPVVRIRSVHIDSQSYQGTQADVMIASWEGSHPNGARLTYSVYYSRNEGKTWEPIGSGLVQTEFSWNLRGFGGSDKALIKVTASDGFNTTSINSEPFRVSAKPPLVSIVTPETEQVPAGQPVLLRAFVFDLQDGVLSGSSLQWFSDKQRDIGNGSTVQSFLQTGRHILTLQVTNSWGQTSTSQKVIRILPATMGTKAHDAERSETLHRPE